MSDLTRFSPKYLFTKNRYTILSTSDSDAPIDIKIKTKYAARSRDLIYKQKHQIRTSIQYIVDSKINELTILPRAMTLKKVEGRREDDEFSSTSSLASKADAWRIESAS